MILEGDDDVAFDYVKVVLSCCASFDVAIHRIRYRGKDRKETDISIPVGHHVGSHIEHVMLEQAEGPEDVPLIKRPTRLMKGDAKTATPIATKELGAWLNAVRETHGQPPTVMIRTGLGVPSSRVMDLITRLRRNGIEKITFGGAFFLPDEKALRNKVLKLHTTLQP